MSHSGLGVRARRSQNVKMRGSRYLPVDPRFEPLHRQIRFPIWVRVLSSSRSEGAAPGLVAQLTCRLAIGSHPSGSNSTWFPHRSEHAPLARKATRAATF